MGLSSTHRDRESFLQIPVFWRMEFLAGNPFRTIAMRPRWPVGLEIMFIILEKRAVLFNPEEHQHRIVLLFELVQDAEYFGVVGVFLQYPGFTLDNAIGWQNGDKQILMSGFGPKVKQEGRVLVIGIIAPNGFSAFFGIITRSYLNWHVFIFTWKNILKKCKFRSFPPSVC